MDDPAVVGAAPTKSGFDATLLLARTPGGRGQGPAPGGYPRSRVARGTFGSPTFFVGNEIFFGKDRLRGVEKEDRTHQIAAFQVFKTPL